MAVVTTPPHHAFGSYRRPILFFVFVFAFAFAPAAPTPLSPLLLARHGGARLHSLPSVGSVRPLSMPSVHACVLWYQETQNQKKKSKREENNTK